jgi:glyoxylase-like metal-dependent hydrolase (beta-lactamase superfamily II)
MAWAVITHPDGDHCGGSAEIKRRYPQVRLAYGDLDRAMIESPDYLFSFRYDAYRANHGIYFDPKTAQDIKNCSSSAQAVTFTFVGGETLRLGENRILEIWHLPGHSHGHLEACTTVVTEHFTMGMRFKAPDTNPFKECGHCALPICT